MSPHIFATPYSAYQSFPECQLLPAQEQELHLQSSSHQDQYHQALPHQYTGLRERYNSLGPGISLQVPYGTSVLPEPFLSGHVVRQGEAVSIISYRTMLEVFAHC